MDVAGKGGDQDASRAGSHQTIERRDDRVLAGRSTGAVGVGAVRQDRQNAFSPQAGQAGQVGPDPVDGIGIDLEVGGVHDRSHRRVQGQHATLGHRVARGYRLHREGPELERCGVG